MQKEIFTIYDSKAENYFTPIFELTIGAALRKFADTLKDDNIISQHPEDFTFFHLGSFDDNSSTFNLLLTPNSLGLAIDFMPKTNSPNLSFSERPEDKNSTFKQEA